jgi:DnaJ-class molecular chaperone
MKLREALALLGLTIEHTPAEAKAAYRKKALELHPDKNPESPERANERFTEVGVAYARVKKYHELGGADGQGDDGSAHVDQDMMDMLAEMFGPRLSAEAAKSIASSLRVQPAVPPTPPKPLVPTNPDLAARIAATRAKEAEARQAKAAASAAAQD